MLLELSLRSAIALLLGLAVGIGGCDKQSPPPEQANDAAAATNAVPAPAVDRSHHGETAPDFAFQGPDGKRLTLASFRGKPLLLNLWATWCAPCVREMPALDALAGAGGPLQVVAVSQDMDGAAKVTPFFQAKGIRHLKPYLDPDLRLSTGFGANLPTTILYDSGGKEVWRLTGGYDWSGASARALIAEAR